MQNRSNKHCRNVTLFSVITRLSVRATRFFLSKELLYASDLFVLKSKHYGGQNVAKNVVQSVGNVSKSNLSQINKKGNKWKHSYFITFNFIYCRQYN